MARIEHMYLKTIQPYDNSVLLRLYVVDDANYTALVQVRSRKDMSVLAEYTVSGTGVVQMSIGAVDQIRCWVCAVNRDAATSEDNIVACKMVEITGTEYSRKLYVGKGIKWVKLTRYGSGVTDSFLTDEEEITIPNLVEFIIVNFTSRVVIMGSNTQGVLDYKVYHGQRWAIVNVSIAVPATNAVEYFYRLATRYHGIDVYDLASKIRYSTSLTDDEKIQLLLALYAKVIELEKEVGLLQVKIEKKAYADTSGSEAEAAQKAATVAGLTLTDTSEFYILNMKMYVRYDIDWWKVAQWTAAGAALGFGVGAVTGPGAIVGAIGGAVVGFGVGLTVELIRDYMTPSQADKEKIIIVVNDARKYLDNKDKEYTDLVNNLYEQGKIDAETRDTLLAWWQDFKNGMMDKLNVIQETALKVVEEAAKGIDWKTIGIAAGAGFVAGAVISKK